jgi:hypothetical protein
MRKIIFSWLVIIVLMATFVTIINIPVTVANLYQQALAKQPPTLMSKPPKVVKILTDKALIIPKVSRKEIIILCQENCALSLKAIYLSEEIIRLLKKIYIILIVEQARLNSLISSGLTEEERRNVQREREEIEKIIILCKNDFAFVCLIRKGCQAKINFYVYVMSSVKNGEHKEKWPEWFRELKKQNNELREAIKKYERIVIRGQKLLD